MHDSGLVQCVERRGELSCNTDHIVERQRPALHALLERRAGHELAREVVAAVRFARLEHGDEMRAADEPGAAGLVVEPPPERLVARELLASTFSATSPPSSRVARKTMPMPPAPSSSSSRKGPSRAPASSCSAAASARTGLVLGEEAVLAAVEEQRLDLAVMPIASTSPTKIT